MKILKKGLYKIANPILSKVSRFKNKHQGETCYLFGDGVSIKYFDLSLFSDKISFSLGKIQYHKDFRFLNCKYCLMLEPYYFYPFFRLKMPPHTLWRNNIQKIYRKFIDYNKGINFFINFSNYPMLWNSKVDYLFYKFPDQKFKFEEECNLKGVNVFQGSLRSSITLAIYMGFKEIFLVGCDYTHEKALSRHWYEKGEGTMRSDGEYDKKFFNIATKYSKITTITLQGKGNVLRAINYNDYTKKVPEYRENIDLSDISNLKTFAEWPGYKIF